MTTTPTISELKEIYLKATRNLAFVMMENVLRPRDPATIYVLGTVREELAIVTAALASQNITPTADWVVIPPRPK